MGNFWQSLAVNTIWNWVEKDKTVDITSSQTCALRDMIAHQMKTSYELGKKRVKLPPKALEDGWMQDDYPQDIEILIGMLDQDLDIKLSELRESLDELESKGLIKKMPETEEASQ